jgi:hypothetical protein
MDHLARVGVPEDELAGLQDAFGENREGDDFLYEDAYPLYAALRDTGTCYFTYTKGGILNQKTKLCSCKLFGHTLLDEPYLITDTAYKGQEIADKIRTHEGLFAVRVLCGLNEQVLYIVAHTIFLLDDKERGFEGLPSDCHGAIVNRKMDLEQTQGAPLVLGRFPVVHDLRTITERVYQRAAERREA